MTTEHVNTIVIGAGQAGLAMSYYLTQHSREHIVLERQRIAERWRSRRWDSLTFQFPNWTMELPGYSYSGANPDAFAPRDEVAGFIEAYAGHIRAPVRSGTPIISLKQKSGSRHFEVHTQDTTIEAAHVVIATGPYQQPMIPQHIQDALPGVVQIHSSRYRNPEQLPPGGVLVVGSGASGCQIVEDLVQSGQRVFLSVGSHRRVPRRYRGRDYAWWAYKLGEFDCPVEQRPLGRAAPLLTGVGGGHDVDLRFLARDGVMLLGHLVSGEDNKLVFAPDLHTALVRGDETLDAFVAAADAYVREHGLNLPLGSPAQARLPDPKEVSAPIRELDLSGACISTIVWATGFQYDFGWVHLPVFTRKSERALDPVHRRGITDTAGAYFLGLQWLSKRKSSLMAGVGEDAEFIARHMDAH